MVFFNITTEKHITFDAIVHESGISGEWVANVLAYFFISDKYGPFELWCKVGIFRVNNQTNSCSTLSYLNF